MYYVFPVILESYFSKSGYMHCISWNCGGSFRTKFEALESYGADVWVIQECEDPARYPDSALSQRFPIHLWKGDNPHKGLGVFVTRPMALQKLDWSDEYQGHKVKYFLPCLLEKEIKLLAVWTHRNQSPNFGYIGQFWKYLQTNGHLFNRIIIPGDFNSNVRWDEWDRWWNHSDVVRLLEERDIHSLYHLRTLEKQGQESQPTFYLQRNPNKAYHIDYCFASREIAEACRSFKIGSWPEWKGFSDHCPIMMEFDL